MYIEGPKYDNVVQFALKIVAGQCVTIAAIAKAKENIS